jgi:hypothetical protein
LLQGVDLVLLTKTWHFPGQHLSHVEWFDSLAVARTIELERTKAIKHSRGVITYFRNHFSPNLSQWKEGTHDSYLWLRVSKGVAPNLFVYMVYITPVGSKHESESLFQNLIIDIVEDQILGGIILLGGDFNVRTATLPNTIDTNDLCELLQVPELVKTKQPNVLAKQHNRDASVGGWDYKLLELCCDVGLLIFNGRTPSDELGEFTCLANGRHNTVNYIIGLAIIWQVITHIEVIINDTRYCAMGVDSHYMLLHLRLNINLALLSHNI